MDYARGLYERFRQLIHEAAKFGTVGIIGVVLNLAIIEVLHSGFGVGQLSAAFAGGAITSVMAYVGNRYWSFRHRERPGIRRETTLFTIFNLIGIAIQVGTVDAFKHAGHVKGGLLYLLANALGIGLGTAFRFWSYRKWVWLGTQQAPEGHETLSLAPATAPAADAGS